MLIYLQSISYDFLSLLLLISFVSIYITKATSSSSFTNDLNNNYVKRADECKRDFKEKYISICPFAFEKIS